jgi:hypothetical protein
MLYSTTGLAWHYTELKKLAVIRAAGFLRAHEHPTYTALGTHGPRRPCLWFTVNDFNEPSISGLHVIRDAARGPERDEAIAHAVADAGGGWVRFGYPAQLLLPIGMTYTAPQLREYRDIIDAWRVSFKDISLTDCSAIDVMGVGLEWERAWTRRDAPVRLPSLPRWWDNTAITRRASNECTS